MEQDRQMEYLPSKEELIEFNKHRSGFVMPYKATSKPPKPTSGRLVLIEGNNVTTLIQNAPFALLRYHMNRYKNVLGYKGMLKIKY